MQIGDAKPKASAPQDRRILGRPRARRAGRAGFTLTEIMIAMGVLAVGMGMVAGALHAGIEVHIRTIDDIMRQLIADNALAMVQARVRHSNANGLSDTFVCLTESGKSYFAPGDLKFPWNDPNTPYGAAVFMKARKEGTHYANDYRVLVVPYRIVTEATTGSPGTVAINNLSGCTSVNYGDGSRITTSAANVLKVGMAVIDTDGKVGLVTSTPSNNTAVTDSKVAGGTLTTLTPPGTARLECSKPIRTDTALTPDPSYVPGS